MLVLVVLLISDTESDAVPHSFHMPSVAASQSCCCGIHMTFEADIARSGLVHLYA